MRFIAANFGGVGAINLYCCHCVSAQKALSSFG